MKSYFYSLKNYIKTHLKDKLVRFFFFFKQNRFFITYVATDFIV